MKIHYLVLFSLIALAFIAGAAVAAPDYAVATGNITGDVTVAQDSVPAVTSAEAYVPTGEEKVSIPQPRWEYSISGVQYAVPQVVPEPGTMALLGMGLLPIAGFLKRRKA